MTNKKKIWISASVFVAIAIAGIVVYLLWPRSSTEPIIETTPSVSVQKGDITVRIKGSGAVKATSQTMVYTDKEGNINQVLGKLNNTVTKGQVLLTYKPKDNSKDLTQQQSTLRQQQNDLHDKQEQYKQQMMDNAAQTELDSTRLAIEKAKDDIATTQTEITRLQKDQAAPAPLVSPTDGTITKVSVFAGGSSSAGSEAFTIINYQDLSATIQVDEMGILKVRQGMKATMQLDALPNQTYTGHVSSIANEGSVKNGVSTFGVTIHLDRPGQIKAGMSAQASILVQHKKNILILPIESIIQQGDAYIVQKLNVSADQQNLTSPITEDQPIRVGIHDESHVEIASGLKVGDLVSVPSSDMSGISTPTSGSSSFDMSGSTGGDSSSSDSTSSDGSSTGSDSSGDSSSTDSSGSSDAGSSSDSSSSNSSTDNSTSNSDSSASTGGA
ncbi:efflux RND transporter periplasmic adaptor subunit [Paenibacillus sp. WLX1005]|uniref:efflux RND transporter periplasmic adaptor subunit n=1 Tax=Paenibacillus sp. WLX1005 TaxID=3243766 RepID=UPI0039843569